MKLLIDIGNQRVKWLTSQQLLASLDVFGQSFDIHDQGLAEALNDRFKQLPEPQQVVVSSVSGNRCRQIVTEISLSLWGQHPEFLQAERFAAGIRNNYIYANQLGVDRWAALVGAWHEYGPGSLVVVDAGTAVTIDILNDQGVFLGGMIFPGIATMIQSLRHSTEQIRVRHSAVFAGEIELTNLQTDPAVTHGAVNAVIGGVDRAISQHKSFLEEDLKTIISGGDAGVIKDHSAHKLIIDSKLVFRGLLLLSNEITR